MEEKKYEEALEKAREIYFNKEYKPNEAALVKEILAELFLELEESESERERKKIINFLDELRTKIGCCLDREECRDIEGRILAIIRWLEKVKDFDEQLEQAYKNSDEVQYKRGYDDGYLEGIVNAKQELKKQATIKDGNSIDPHFGKPITTTETKTQKFKVKYAGREYNVLEIRNINGVKFYGIEDEPNHIDYVKAESCKIISGYAIKESGYPYPTKPAVFSEQNPADKVEPKFKIGDWVVDEEDNHVYQVKRVVTNVSSGMSGYDLSDGGYFYSTKTNCHLWSIADAKDGDVLVPDDMIVLFKKRLENNSILTHFHYDTTDDECEPGCRLYYADIYPATKEQRELLSRKMEEAGYKWDDEKKELTHKEVTKKSDKVWNEEDERSLKQVVAFIRREINEPTSKSTEEWLKSIKARLQ